MEKGIKKNLSKLLVILTAVVLVMCIFPLTAYAAGPTIEVGVDKFVDDSDAYPAGVQSEYDEYYEKYFFVDMVGHDSEFGDEVAVLKI